MFPSIIPTLNQILFNGDSIFEFIKPKIKKIIDKIADQTLKLPPLNNGNIETIKKKGSISDFKIENMDNIVSCIGHLKYRTSNMNNDITIDEICPIGDNNLSIVHNGNIPNIDSFDTKYIYDMIKNFGDIKCGLINLINTIPASYCIIVQYGNARRLMSRL